MSAALARTLHLAAIFLATFAVAMPAGAQPSDQGSGSPRTLKAVTSCPPTAKKEVAVMPFARDDSIPSDCATAISVVNLGKKDVEVQCDFFIAGGNLAGSASLTVSPGQSKICATRATMPFQIKSINSTASTGTFQGHARVCASSNKIGIDASLSCDTASGAWATRLSVIVKKLRGD